MTSPRDSVAVLGAGRMGRALATWLHHVGHPVLLWNRTPERARDLLARGELPAEVELATDLPAVAERARTIFFGLPVSAVQEVVLAFADALQPDHRVVLVSKGIDAAFQRGSEIVHGHSSVRRIAMLGGPLLATEIAAGRPQAIVVASRFDAMLEEVRRLLDRPRTWLVGTHDVAGVEIAGALRNVSSVAMGLCESLGLSEASRSLILTRGLLDAGELGRTLGASPETFHGLCGVGDLVARRNSEDSRNFRLGLRLGEGAPLDRVLAELPGEPEGVTTARAAREYGARKGLSLVVVRAVAAVMDGAPARDELEALLSMAFGAAPLAGRGDRT